MKRAVDKLYKVRPFNKVLDLWMLLITIFSYTEYDTHLETEGVHIHKMAFFITKKKNPSLSR